MKKQMYSVVAFSGVAVVVAMLSGCRVEKTEHGDGKDVNISTPFGGMHVKTNSDVVASIGLPAYPGAQAINDDGNDNHSADVDMSFGGFQLRVKAARFHSDDAPDKVEDFYRGGLKRFGDVIACKNNQPVGSPAKTSEGLTCSNDHGNHITVDNHHGGTHQLELKAGSQQHQHIVTLDPDGAGTKFGLVALDLPGKMTYEGNDKGE
jgi:hypothetical protein